MAMVELTRGCLFTPQGETKRLYKELRGNGQGRKGVVSNLIEKVWTIVVLIVGS